MNNPAKAYIVDLINFGRNADTGAYNGSTLAEVMEKNPKELGVWVARQIGYWHSLCEKCPLPGEEVCLALGIPLPDHAKVAEALEAIQPTYAK